MFFRLSCHSAYSDIKLHYKAFVQSQKNLALYQLTTDDILLDRFCREAYSKSLKIICFELIKKLTWSLNKNNEIIGTFKSKLDDNLATLITYGNGKLKGSNILHKALSD